MCHKTKKISFDKYLSARKRETYTVYYDQC